MAKRVRFIHGKKYHLHCSRCDAKRSAVVYRELCDWRARYSCGHHRTIGFTAPLDYLNEEGLVNQQAEEKDDTFDTAYSEELERAKERAGHKAAVERSRTRNRLYY